MRSALQYKTLFDETISSPQFPSTRYQGSKLKFLDWIWEQIKDIPFRTALDAFGGTGCLAYKFKQEGKVVYYNDILPFNHIIGKALIENAGQVLNEKETDRLLTPYRLSVYPHFIEQTFKDIYFTDEENLWIDMVSANIRAMDNPYKQAIAYFALFQSCIIKRPYNLFHRKNLYVRTQHVQRSFGNKTTWDTPFEVHFRKFIKEANNAVFDNGENCRSLNSDAIALSEEFDLVYIDTPYINEKGIGVDYADFYHFLNGLVNYDNWPELIDYQSKHLRLKRTDNEWNNKTKIQTAFERLFARYHNSILVISYRSNGIPSIEYLCSLLTNRGRTADVIKSNKIKYALSHSKSQEILIISRPQ